MQEFTLSRFLDMAAFGAIMRVSLFVCAAGAVSLMVRLARMRRAGQAAASRAGGPDAVGDAAPGRSPGLLAGPLSWLAILSPAAPVFAFVIMFEIEAAQAFLASDCGGPGGDCLTRVLVWPAFVFVGLGVLAACVSVCRGLRSRLGGAALWPCALAPILAGALAAMLIG